MSEVKPTIRERCDTLQSKLTEMEQCLSWASDNVVVIVTNHDRTEWHVRSTSQPITAPTLYAALKSAWEGRDK